MILLHVSGGLELCSHRTMASSYRQRPRKETLRDLQTLWTGREAQVKLIFQYLEQARATNQLVPLTARCLFVSCLRLRCVHSTPRRRHIATPQHRLASAPPATPPTTHIHTHTHTHTHDHTPTHQCTHAPKPPDRHTAGGGGRAPAGPRPVRRRQDKRTAQRAGAAGGADRIRNLNTNPNPNPNPNPTITLPLGRGVRGLGEDDDGSQGVPTQPVRTRVRVGVSVWVGVGVGVRDEVGVVGRWG